MLVLPGTVGFSLAVVVNWSEVCRVIPGADACRMINFYRPGRLFPSMLGSLLLSFVNRPGVPQRRIFDNDNVWRCLAMGWPVYWCRGA